MRLARLYISNHVFEITKVPTPIEDAIAAAQRAVRVDSMSRRARCILAFALLVKGELAAARDAVDQALELSPGSLVYLELSGLLLALLGDGERGPELIRKARARNPYSLPYASIGLWFDHLRRGELEPAYLAALDFRDATFFWRGVMRASCLGLLGRSAENEVAELLQKKPDFASRGRTLIGYYVKDSEVMDRIAEGLARVGLKLD
jgi:tetratricopeptide (TPR) repeat protein